MTKFKILCILKKRKSLRGDFFMKQGIHPDYHEVEVVCACGATFTTKTTKPGDRISVEICKNCHPLYTGKRKVVDSSGRVDKFKKKYNLD